MEKLNGKTVFIIDDDSRNRYALSSYLEQCGMKVLPAGNGREAIAQLENGVKADIILLDMMMPVMDGFETLAALKNNGLLASVPVIAVTARAMKGDREKCLAAGAWDYIAKPLNLKALAAIMNRWIQ